MKLRRVPPSPAVLAAVTEDGPTAALRALADLCRQCPELRTWLWQDFAREATVRERFAAFLAEPTTPMSHGIASLNGEDLAWQTERAHLRKQTAPGLYGGLTWSDVEALFRRFEAGTLDLGTFLLAHRWHEARGARVVSPELVRGSVAFLDTVTRHGDRRLLKHYYRALSFLRAYEAASDRRRALGYAEWWKLRLLLYILRRPQRAYRVRELRAHLAGLDLNVSALDIRRFCVRHGIRRDMRAGRPRSLARAGD